MNYLFVSYTNTHIIPSTFAFVTILTLLWTDDRSPNELLVVNFLSSSEILLLSRKK